MRKTSLACLWLFVWGKPVWREESGPEDVEGIDYYDYLLIFT